MYNASAFLGYRGKNGYSHLNATVYDNRQGIPDGSRDSLTRQFTYQVYETKGENVLQPHTDNITSRPIVPQNVLNSYDISPLSQRIQDYRFYTDNFYHIGQSDVTASVGFEQNRRREFDHPTDIDQAGEYIVLNTLDYNFRVNCPSVLHIEPSVGINGMYQSNSNKNATDFPIPDYRLFDIGSYIYGKWKHNRWTIAGGIRYDHRSENGDEMYIRPNLKTGFYQKVGATDTAGATMQFPAFRLQFEGVTGSIGTTYRINEYLSLKGNIARGYRAPNITEIASDGLDPGAHIYYVGNLGFKPEFSLQEDMGLNGSYPDLSFNLSVFDNYIENYIYEDQEVDKNGNPIVIVPGSKTFQYQQTNAQLYGGDATLNIHPQKWKRWDFDNTFSIVYGYNLNKKYQNAGVQGQYLPFVPPPKLLSSVSYNLLFNNKILPSLNLKGSIDYNAAQHRYLGLYNTETPTPAYWLIDVSVHTDIYYSEKHAFQLLLAVNNLLNTAYQSHLSRLQYFEYYTYSPNGHYGIYNMGRNLCFKIIIPF
jgi:iron complex outermembrane receptor protein